MLATKKSRHGKSSGAFITLLILSIAAAGFYFLVLKKTPQAAEPREEAPPVEEKPAPDPVPKVEPKPQPDTEVEEEVKPDPKPEPEPDPVVKTDPKVDAYLEKKFPIPQFRSLESVVRHWKKVPKKAFPEEVTVLMPATYKTRTKTQSQTEDSGHLAKPIRLVAGKLTLSHPSNPKLLTRVAMEKTNFKEEVRKLYEQRIEAKTQAILQKREDHRQEAIAFLKEQETSGDAEISVQPGKRSASAKYAHGDYWKDLSPSIAGEKVYGSPEDKNSDTYRDAHGMYHRGDIVFTPLGQLDAYAISSRKYQGLMLYSIEYDSLLAEAGLQQWDTIYKVNGASLPANPDETREGTPGVRLFAKHLIETEEKGGTLTLYVKRASEKHGEPAENLKFDIKLRKKGSFNAYLERGEFNDRAAEHSLAALEYLLATQQEDGSWKCGYGSQLSTSLAGTHLIMAAEKHPEMKPKILRALKKSTEYLTEKQNWDWGWDDAAASWFFAEYFWATADHKMYGTLHDYLDRLQNTTNPLGGVTHKSWGAPYNNINLGGPSGLARMALKAAKFCKAANYSESNAVLMDKYVFDYMGGSGTDGANASGYMGHVAKFGNIGADAMNTGMFLAGAYKTDFSEDPYGSLKKPLTKGMYQLLHEGTLQVNHIHATPTLGTIFTAIALSAVDKDSADAIEKALVHQHTWKLALSLDSKDRFQYSYPRHARMSLPGGGGWNGDHLMGLQHLAAVSSLSMLHAPSKNLLVNAAETPKSFGWLNPKNTPKESWKKVATFHQKRFEALLKEIQQTAKKAPSLAESLVLTDKLLDNYPPSSFPYLYTKDTTRTLATVVKLAEKQKVEMPDYVAAEVEAFLKDNAFANEPSKADEWIQRFEKHHKKRTLKQLTQRVKELN